MRKSTSLESRIESWVQEGLLDSAAAQRILAFEAARGRQTTLRWPILLAVGFGGILIAAGVTLFVAAHWDELSPAARFTLVVAMVAIFHAGGALVADRLPALSTTLHAVGTAVLGAAIFLAAQIFNLQENWPTGILLWAIGAAAAFLLLRHWTQAGFVAVLIPFWLISQWTYATDEGGLANERVPTFGALLVALCYLSARVGDQEDPIRRTLVWIGGIALFPAAITAILIARESGVTSSFRPQLQVTPMMQLTGWTIALLAPLAVAGLLRGKNVWANFVCAIWAFTVVEVAGIRGSRDRFSAVVLLYLLCGLGAVGLVSWGLHEKRKERLNLGIAGFALTVLFFYFDNFMDKLGRAASLLTLGVLCLAGGWALERTRKRLLARMETA